MGLRRSYSPAIAAAVRINGLNAHWVLVQQEIDESELGSQRCRVLCPKICRVRKIDQRAGC